MEDEVRSQSLAVTVDELARLHTIITDNVYKRDFVTPQASHSSEREPQDEKETPRAYILRQTSPTSQTLTSIACPSSTGYNITFNLKGGLWHKKPHIRITKHENGHCAELATTRFENNTVNTTITFRSPNLPPSLLLKDLGNDRFRCSIMDIACRWQPLGPSINVLELVKEMGGKVALFVYSENVPPRRGSLPGNLKRYGKEDVGELHIVDDCLSHDLAREEIFASAVVVVERLKRRAITFGY